VLFRSLMNPIRDDTNKALQYRHISSVLTDLLNGLDTCLRRNDKTFSHKLVAGNPALFKLLTKLNLTPIPKNKTLRS
ncbi:MAG: hypothetical protein RBS43_08120, partial [Candidatus Cloacimonas sp.]|nr:hypothetical protein [Candidatus Cloacimonas sp.]